MDDYPIPEVLKQIEDWDIIKQGVESLIKLLQDQWHWPDWGVVLEGKSPPSIKRGLKLELHTGGWSGNESIIDALENNKNFFNLFWVKTFRGGHYYFEIMTHLWLSEEERNKNGLQNKNRLGQNERK